MTLESELIDRSIQLHEVTRPHGDNTELDARIARLEAELAECRAMLSSHEHVVEEPAAEAEEAVEEAVEEVPEEEEKATEDVLPEPTHILLRRVGR